MNFSNVKCAALLALLVPVLAFGKLPKSFYEIQAQVPTLQFERSRAEEGVAYVIRVNDQVDALEQKIAGADSADVAILMDLYQEAQRELDRALALLQRTMQYDANQVELAKGGVYIL